MTSIEQAAGTASQVHLDPSQRAVLELGLRASAAVLGAPGTGKTTTLVELVAARVDAGVDPDHVLAIAASRTSATRLRDRLALRIGRPTNGPLARTASSLAFALVGSRAVADGAEAPRLLTGGEQDQIVAELLEGHIEDGRGPDWPEPLDPSVRRLRGFRTELRELMARAVEYGVDARRLAALGAEHGHPEWQAASAFIAEYEQVIDAYRGEYLDSAQLQARAAWLLSGAGAAADGRAASPLAHLELLVVDDLQEATVATLHMLREIARSGVPVIAFGDPDVSSSSFRGARADAIGRLGSLLGVPVQTLVLSTAHRQAGPRGAELRALTSRVTERIGTAGAGAQRAARSASAGTRADGSLSIASHAATAVDGATTASLPAIARIEAASPQAESNALARRLREHHLLRSVPWNEMAVVVRSGAHVPALARALSLAEVPTRTSVAARALRDEFAARSLVDAASVALGLRELDAPLADELLRGPLGGLDSVSIRRLRLALRHEELAGAGERTGEELLAEAVAMPGRLATIESAAARRARRFAETLAAAREVAEASGTIEEVLWALWERSALAREWVEQGSRGGILADEANRNLDAVVAVFTAAKRFVERSPERPAGDFVTEFLGAEVPEDTLAPRSAAQSVLIATPSAVVGTEFEIVAVSGVQEGVWPNLRLRGSLVHPGELVDLVEGLPVDRLDDRAAVLSDELRMFALAVSRARTQVILTALANDDEQPSPFFGLSGVDPESGVAAHPLSLRGMVGALRRTLAAGPYTSLGSSAAAALAVLAGAGVAGADTADWYGLREPSTSEPLEDPDDPEVTVRVSPSSLEKFERSPLAWFVDRMASAPSGLSAGIGTIVHAVFEELGADPTDLSTERVWAGIERRWHALEFETELIEKQKRRDARRMADGVSEYLRDFARSGGALVAAERRFEVQVGRALITGSIDRVERTRDGAIVVVDLKTGKYEPSRRAMDEHAQLGAYQLAIAHGALDDEPVGPEPEHPRTDLRAPTGGAKLVFVARKRAHQEYVEFVQNSLDADGIVAFETRVLNAAAGMSGAVFSAPAEPDEYAPDAKFPYRVQIVPAVSA